MSARSTSSNLAFARQLRREMTMAEAMLWRALRGSRFAGLKFRRQAPVGPYIADFLCIASRLIVELDGRDTPLDITARSDEGEIMGLRHASHPTYGVQFHPEFTSKPMIPHPLFRDFVAAVVKRHG